MISEAGQEKEPEKGEKGEADSMDSTPDSGPETLEEAKKTIRDLRAKFRAQSHELLAWRRRVRQQEELIARMNLERTERLRSLASQLLLFESRLCRKQRNISRLLVERETTIKKQQQLIQRLQTCLNDAGLECGEETNLDSLNDSDSAVIMEDDDVYRPLCPDVTVVRSISDALESKSFNKSQSTRRNNGYLRRPEVLETVYSVEEDGDGDGQNSTSGAEPTATVSDPEEVPVARDCKLSRGRLKELSGSFEILDKVSGDECNQSDPPSHTAYNRVMSNHRSVTKPKDVKYKRINKAKSKSLEELRGRLKNWVDKGNRINISLDQSYA